MNDHIVFQRFYNFIHKKQRRLKVNNILIVYFLLAYYNLSLITTTN